MSVRREITEKRISQNIQNYNSATVMPETADLFIGRSKDYETSMINEESTARRSLATQSIDRLANRSHLKSRRSTVTLSEMRNISTKS